MKISCQFADADEVTSIFGSHRIVFLSSVRLLFGRHLSPYRSTFVPIPSITQPPLYPLPPYPPPSPTRSRSRVSLTNRVAVGSFWVPGRWGLATSHPKSLDDDDPVRSRFGFSGRSRVMNELAATLSSPPSSPSPDAVAAPSFFFTINHK